MEGPSATLGHPEGGDNVEGGEEDGAVRCICGNPDYQGPTAAELELPVKSPAIAVATIPKLDVVALESGVEPDGALFIQCDTCETWQHGPCVGIMTNDTSPENYFCEECRPHYHQIVEGPNG
jgi:hypothetical protein